MATLTKSPLARQDLSDIFQYLAAETDIERARKFLLLIEEKCELLAKFPEMGRARHEFVVSLRSFPVKNYIVFYLSAKNGIEVLRVLHAPCDIPEVFDEMIDGMRRIN